MRERETARAAPAPTMMQRQHVPPCAPRGLGEIEVLLVAGKAVEEHQRGMRSRTGGGVEQRVHCSIARRDHQRRHGRRVCGIARWIDGYRRLDLRGRLPRRQDRCREGRKAIAPAISMVRAMVMVSPSPAGHADSFDRVATTTSTSPPGVRCGHVSNVQSPCGCARPPRRRDRRRFHPGGAEKRQEFAGADPEVDVIGGHNLTKPLGNASEFDVCRFGCQGSRGCR